MSERARPSTLYPILDAGVTNREDIARDVRAFASAGCRMVQLRGKKLSTQELVEWAQEAVEAAHASDVLLIVNDRADVALVSDADGVHLGQDDLSAADARKVLGADAIIGFSTHSLEQARASDGLPIDYVAIGPVFDTRSKENPDDTVGIEGVRQVRGVTDLPLVAIGGVTLETASSLLSAGADAVAVISALYRAKDSGAGAEASLSAEAQKWMDLGSSNESRQGSSRKQGGN